MSGFTRIGRVDAFRDGRGRVVTVDGVKVAVFRVGTSWYAIKDACPHMGASLGDGRVEEGRVTCHMHGWTFDLVTGVCSQTRQKSASIYEVKIDGDAVLVRPPPPLPSPTAPEDDDDEWVVFDPNKHLKRK